ncbi:hypothetical protein QYF36_019852 [Acer negundo]|nr:hypothetical protein QYF36_019852 [Acer negundo]
MKASVVTPNSYTFSFICKCCDSFEAFKYGQVIHGETVRLGFGSNVFVQNNILDLYAICCGNSGLAWKVFDEMPERDVVSWNLMIGAYMRHDEIEAAIDLFELMPERSIVTWNSVVSGLSKKGNMELARMVFERMPERNEISWNSLISVYVRIGDMEAAKCIFDQMPKKTVVSWTALITGYTMIGDLEAASNIFNIMSFKNMVSWNAMISGYVQNHMFDQAVNMFNLMLTDAKCKPDQTTLGFARQQSNNFQNGTHSIRLSQKIEGWSFKYHSMYLMLSSTKDQENLSFIFTSVLDCSEQCRSWIRCNCEIKVEVASYQSSLELPLRMQKWKMFTSGYLGSN